MALRTWLSFCAMEAVLCAIPGPAVLFVVSTALARAARAGIAAALGIVAANTLYFALSWTGVAVVIATSSALFTALKWCGAAYLVWIGLGMLLSRAEPATAPSGAGGERAFLRALVVQGGNPKALVFFMALLPQFIDSTGRVGLKLMILGLSSLVIELVVLGGYLALAVRARRLAGARFASSLERIGGGVLTALGVRMALARIG